MYFKYWLRVNTMIFIQQCFTFSVIKIFIFKVSGSCFCFEKPNMEPFVLTFVNSSGQTLLDLIFTKKPDRVTYSYNLISVLSQGDTNCNCNSNCAILFCFRCCAARLGLIPQIWVNLALLNLFLYVFIWVVQFKKS